MAVENLQQYTVDEFEALADSDENRDRLLELIDGEIVEKVPTEEHGMIAGNIYAPLWAYVAQHKAGRVVMEVRYRAPEDKRNSRIPDISFSTKGKPSSKKAAFPVCPILQ